MFSIGGLSGNFLEAFWEPPGSSLGASWELLGASGSLLGGFWELSGSFLGAFWELSFKP